MSNMLLPNHGVTITVAASDKLATYSSASYSVGKTIGYPNLPDTDASVFSGSGLNTTSAFSAATTVTIQAGDAPLFYQTGTGPVIPEVANRQTIVSATPGALNATGTLTAALILGGIVTSSTASAVTATLDTGTVMDGAIDLAVGDAFQWSAINTGGTNAFTVTASTAHTLVGAGAVAANSSGLFITRKSAAATYITYRVC